MDFLLLCAYFGNNDSILVLGDFCEENNICFQGLINADVEESLPNIDDNYYHHNGYGDGDCYGDGHGDGHGNSDGDGYSDGYGNSDGNGHGNGYKKDER